jgi:hypothetical protein
MTSSKKTSGSTVNKSAKSGHFVSNKAARSHSKTFVREAPNKSDYRLIGLKEKRGRVVGIKDKHVIVEPE